MEMMVSEHQKTAMQVRKIETIDDLKIGLLKELLDESNLPYKVDIVVLNGNEKYADIVKREGIKWN